MQAKKKYYDGPGALNVIRVIEYNSRIYKEISDWLKANSHKPMLVTEFVTYPEGVSSYNEEKAEWQFTPTVGERFCVELSDSSFFEGWPNISYSRPEVVGVIEGEKITSIEVIEPR